MPRSSTVDEFSRLPQKLDEIFDLITPKLTAVQFCQLALTARKAPAGSFDVAASSRGKTLFEGAAKCATCHVLLIYVEPVHHYDMALTLALTNEQKAEPRRGTRAGHSTVIF